MGLDGPGLIRAKWYRPPGRPAPLLPGHPLPSPAQEMGFPANQCHGIKSGVKCSLVYGARLGGWDGRVPLGPRTRDLARAPPVTAPPVAGSPLSGTFLSVQDDSRSWPPGGLMPAPRSG